MHHFIQRGCFTTELTTKLFNQIVATVNGHVKAATVEHYWPATCRLHTAVAVG